MKDDDKKHEKKDKNKERERRSEEKDKRRRRLKKPLPSFNHPKLEERSGDRRSNCNFEGRDSSAAPPGG